jgi:molybdate transport system substrate-binding protein
MSTRGIVLVLTAVAACSRETAGDEVARVRVAAAADLGKAFVEVGDAFRARTGIEASFQFGSSGALAKQISEGAPFYLFAAASKKFAQQALASGRCDGATARLYGRGRIAIWTRNGTKPPANLNELTDERWKTIAIANPDHAPYGLAATQALERAGLWDRLRDRIVHAENVQVTLVYARDGNADAAIVALSLAIGTEGGSYTIIDEKLHDPLEQQLVVCGTGREAEHARKLGDFISSTDGRAIMSRYGFTAP